MTATDPHPAFPFARAAIALTAATAFMLAQAWWFVPWLCGDQPITRQAVLAVFALAWVASILSIAPVALLGAHGVMAAAYGYFIGMAIRLPLCLAGVIILNRRADMPANALVAALAMSYLPLLAIEATFMGRYLWNKDFLGSQGNGRRQPDAAAAPVAGATPAAPTLNPVPPRNTEVPA